MSEMTVNSWHRKGRHRLYVSRSSDHTSIGYWDLAANEPHPNHPGDLHTLVRYVRRWREEHPVEAAWWMKPDEDPAEHAFAASAGTDVREPVPEVRAESPIRTLWKRVRGTDEPERNWRTAGG